MKEKCIFCGQEIEERPDGSWVHPNGIAYMGDCRDKIVARIY